MNSTCETSEVNEDEFTEFDFLLADFVDICGSQSGNSETYTTETEKAFRSGFRDAASKSLTILRESDDPNESLKELEQAAIDQRVYGDSAKAARTRGFAHGLISALQLLQTEDDFEQKLPAFELWSTHVDVWAASGCDRVVIIKFFDQFSVEDLKQQEEPVMEIKPATTEPPKLRIIPAGELVSAYPTLRPAVIDDLLRNGEIMNLVGQTKVRKSWAATDLALAVATGGKWLGDV